MVPVFEIFQIQRTAGSRFGRIGIKELTVFRKQVVKEPVGMKAVI
jgi:hypothetical protein